MKTNAVCVAESTPRAVSEWLKVEKRVLICGLKFIFLPCTLIQQSTCSKTCVEIAKKTRVRKVLKRAELAKECVTWHVKVPPSGLYQLSFECTFANSMTHKFVMAATEHMDFDHKHKVRVVIRPTKPRAVRNGCIALHTGTKFN